MYFQIFPPSPTLFLKMCVNYCLQFIYINLNFGELKLILLWCQKLTFFLTCTPTVWVIMNHKKEKKVMLGFLKWHKCLQVWYIFLGKKNFIQTSVGHIQIHKMNKRSQLFLPFLINACVIHNVKVITLLKLDIYRLVWVLRSNTSWE